MTANTVNSRATISDALLRRLHLIAQGKEAQHADRITIATATLDGVLLGRGLVRTVKHRDHTRSYELTDLGREILNARAKGRCDDCAPEWGCFATGDGCHKRPVNAIPKESR